MLPPAILVDIIGSDNILPEKEIGRSAFISVSLHILESFVSTKTNSYTDVWFYFRVAKVTDLVSQFEHNHKKYDILLKQENLCLLFYCTCYLLVTNTVDRCIEAMKP
jgi:hypothetical protein